MFLRLASFFADTGSTFRFALIYQTDISTLAAGSLATLGAWLRWFGRFWLGFHVNGLSLMK